MNCAACGHENPPAAKFCLDCGGAFARRCAACATDLPAGAKFCLECGAAVAAGASGLAAGATPVPARSPADYTPPHLRDKILQSKSALEGERKQVTVFFADVKGSMDLAEHLDPEAWHHILDRFFRVLTEAVHRFEGTVNQYTGDGIMALFGAPIAHEDHAQRACYAALHVRSALRALQDELRLAHGIDLAVRIGLHSGAVVVGKIGDDLRMDYTAQGHTVGLAQRMEAIAAANTVMLSGATAEHVSGYFALRDLGTTAVKGVSRPVRVFQLEGPGTARTRLDISRERGFSKFVGRNEEMSQLEAAKVQAETGRGQVVGIVADAGSGKSRLCHEFTQRCRAEGLNVYTAHGVSHGNAVPLHPILSLYRAALGLEEGDDDVLARRKIAGALAQLDRDLLDLFPLFCEFLGVPDPQNPAPGIAAPERERRIIGLLKRILQVGSARQNSVVLFEDLHSFDAGSDRILKSLVETVGGTRTLLLVNFRPEYRADWMGRSYYRQLPLAPLSPEAIAELLDDLLGTDQSLAGLGDRIREHTGGNPYFIEEVVLTLVEAGALDGARGHYRLVRPVDAIEIPASVQAVLAARIDRLPDGDKRVLQAAAVIGREFAGELVARVVDGSDVDVEAALRALVQAEFLYETSLYPRLEFAFKHPLTRDVAYDSQLRERRREQHGRAAAALKDVHAGRLDEHAAVIAGHLEAAGTDLDAARWYARAARCTGALASADELAHWLKVRDLLPRDALEGETLQLAAEAAGQIVMVGGRRGLSHDEFELACQDALRLGKLAGDRRTEALVYIARYFSEAYGSNYQNRVSLEAAYQAAQRSGDIGVRLTACTYSGFHEGLPLAERLARAEEGIALANGDISLGSKLVGISPLPVAHAMRAWILAELGRLPEAWHEREKGERILRELGDPATELIWCMNASTVPQIAGDHARALADVRRALDLAERLQAPILPMAFRLLCRNNALQGNWEEVEAGLQQMGVDDSLLQGPRAMLHLARGELDMALAAADALARQPAQSWDIAAFRLTRARVLIAREGPAARQAIEAEIEVVRGWLEDLGAEGQLPMVHEVQAELALALGNDHEHRRELERAATAYEAVGATPHAARVRGLLLA